MQPGIQAQFLGRFWRQFAIHILQCRHQAAGKGQAELFQIAGKFLDHLGQCGAVYGAHRAHLPGQAVLVVGGQMGQLQRRAFADQKSHHDGGFLPARQFGFCTAFGAGGTAGGRVLACGCHALRWGDLRDCGKLCHLGPLHKCLGHYGVAEVNFRLMF